MTIFNSLNTSASALTAQRLRMDVVSSNIANAETTRGKFVDGEWQPYQRKMVEIKEKDSFSSMLSRAGTGQAGSGVQVTKISDDSSPFKLVYDPGHPDADAQGYVKMPNVDPLKEMTDLISSTRSYEANVTVFNASKNMLLKALEIGK
ncbi:MULTISPECIES: flagellar basal body rod protein FlgC [Bacillaceae]|uniref:Flagellar basal-body rod protein FlgC n=1 Tax=Metabacillus sediminis TaxID=3117746 RepID=A0ABZ2NLP9_9BACI|nr:flagellar basal body rod protein FlgC [Bacillus sp. SJS]KZZ82854.1 flagellar basal body rod protein FlgC [Bacillus sp. SJS]